MKKYLRLVLGLMLVFAFPAFAQNDEAFPGAAGHGSESLGGKGGREIYVTNLNNSGVGSFKAAAQDSTGPRIIVFLTSGTIPLSDVTAIKNPYITIACQTAPEPGITFSSTTHQGFIRINTHDVIIRGMRFRKNIYFVGDSNQQSIYNVDVVSPAYNVIFDHCSFVFSDDTIFNLWKYLHHITIQYSIIGLGPWEGLNGAGTKTGEQPAEFISIINDLLIHNRRRNLNSNWIIKSEFVNNAVVNCRIPGGDLIGAGSLDFVGNVYQPGVNSVPAGAFYEVQGGIAGTTKYYVNDNTITKTGYTFASGIEPYLSTTRIGASGYQPRPSSTVIEHLRQNVGPFPRDTVDRRLISDMVNNTGQWVLQPSEIGGFPPVPVNTRTKAQWTAFVTSKGGIENAMNSYYGDVAPPPPDDCDSLVAVAYQQGFAAGSTAGYAAGFTVGHAAGVTAGQQDIIGDMQILLPDPANSMFKDTIYVLRKQDLPK